MALKNLLRLGPSEYDIDGKDSACFWIHPNGFVFIRKSFANAVCGWKVTNKTIIDYWGREWVQIIPSNQVPMEEIVYS